MCSIFRVRFHRAFPGHHFGDTDDVQGVRNPESNKVDPSPLASFWVHCSAIFIDQSLYSLCTTMRVINQGRIRNPISPNSLTWP